jgi:hypothetical protein
VTALVRRWLAAAAITVLPAALSAQHPQAQRFDHARHRQLFPTCTTCHVEPAQGEGPLYPDAAKCAACHDGTIEPRVDWRPPPGPRRTNLRFDHALVQVMTPPGQPEPPGCTVCHGEADKPWMTVERVSMTRCLTCHRVTTAHLAAPDSACTVCHLALPQAAQLTREDIAAFPEPPSHLEPGWIDAHGRAARGGSDTQVAARCTICHAREFCLQCHVDAPERPIIQSLPSDPRATAIIAHLAPPASHAEPAFLNEHGAMAARAPARCATCHARESCLTCHAAATPRAVALLPARAPGRGVGAIIQRHRPAFHGQNFTMGHAAMAERNSNTCAGCHVRADCLSCHRPDPGAANGYHPAGFLTRHPAAAYARETSCADCHNVAGFCTQCHAAAGLRASGLLRPGYHDANPSFILGHGQAARQSLETCTACHAERDCLTCHSANGGRRFDPHGPGFDAARLRRKNPQMCTVCHGTAIPTQ